MECFYVDTFTDSLFTGNPTVVCIDDTNGGLTDDVMQKIAMETNLTETLFISNVDSDCINGNPLASSSVFNIRSFSPTCEVGLCGHGTLAASYILTQVYSNRNSTIYFKSLSGELKTVLQCDNTIDVWLPLIDSRPIGFNSDDVMVKTFVELTVGVDVPVQHCYYSEKGLKLLIRLTDHTPRCKLEELRLPDMQAMMAVKQDKIKGIIVTVKADQTTEEGKGYDFFSRYFTPWYGNPEDYVTGAAHCVLVPYWSEQLNKKVMRARQCSPRGGDLGVAINENGDSVIVSGSARIALKGKLNYT